MRPDPSQRACSDELSAGFSAVSAMVKRLGDDAWGRPVRPGGRTVAEVAHHFAAILADAVTGKPRPTDERLESAAWWGPVETAAEARRRARTIVTYLRRLPPDRWPLRRRNGFTPVEGAARLAFHTWAHGDAIVRALHLDVDLRCTGLAARHAQDELEGRYDFTVVDLGEHFEARAPRGKARLVDPPALIRLLERRQRW